MPKRKNLCPRCLKERVLTRHHVYSRSAFGNKRNTCCLHLCRECHDKIDNIFLGISNISKNDCIEIHRQWLLGNNPTIFLP